MTRKITKMVDPAGKDPERTEETTMPFPAKTADQAMACHIRKPFFR